MSDQALVSLAKAGGKVDPIALAKAQAAIEPKRPAVGKRGYVVSGNREIGMSARDQFQIVSVTLGDRGSAEITISYKGLASQMGVRYRCVQRRTFRVTHINRLGDAEFNLIGGDSTQKIRVSLY